MLIFFDILYIIYYIISYFFIPFFYRQLEMQCSVDQCAFFANKGCEGVCSIHAWRKTAVLLHQLTPGLPQEMLQMIWKCTGPKKHRFLTDDEIAACLGLCPEKTFLPSSVIDERILWMRRAFVALPEARVGVLDFLDEAEHRYKKLRVADAERLMVALDLCQWSMVPRYELEKTIVIHTFHRGALQHSLFPVGICYHGTSPCTSSMTTQTIRRIILGGGICGGGGGGGGGGGIII